MQMFVILVLLAAARGVLYYKLIDPEHRKASLSDTSFGRIHRWIEIIYLVVMNMVIVNMISNGYDNVTLFLRLAPIVMAVLAYRTLVDWKYNGHTRYHQLSGILFILCGAAWAYMYVMG